ncbi:MAG: alpha/beta fold hydrolase [Rhizobacter sp.]
MTPTWVLLRGLTRETGHWGRFLAGFQAACPGARVIALDLPGAGARHGDAAPLRVADMAARCRDELLQGGVTPPYRLVGLSLGGMVAVAWAAACRAEVSHCVLINASMRPFGAMHQRLRPSVWPALAGLAMRRDPMAVERRILDMTSSQPAEHAAVLDEWVAIRRTRPMTRGNAIRQLWAAARFRAPAWPAAVNTLVLCSDGDRLVDPACSHRLAARWSCRLAVHPHAGHDLPLDDGAWVMRQIVQAFG